LPVTVTVVVVGVTMLGVAVTATVPGACFGGAFGPFPIEAGATARQVASAPAKIAMDNLRIRFLSLASPDGD
jgi:hypothetical protein